MKSEYIEKIFEDYLRTSKTQFAILINGDWGSGKTFFFKNKLISIASRESFTSVYLSLNGLSKIDDLKYQFLVKLVPVLNVLDAKKANFLKTIVSTLAQRIGSIDINEILKDIEIDANKLTNYIVCFDDFERCLIPKEEVLGFINNYVEHKHLKVLVLSDEGKITRNDTYNNIKEKVIGRVLNYKSDLNNTIRLLLETYKTNQHDFYQEAINQIDFILDLLNEFKVQNLRNISFYFSILSKLYFVAKRHGEYWREVVFFTLIITIEFKKGNLVSNDYASYKGLEGIVIAYAFFDRNNIDGRNENTAQESDAEIFYKNYLINHNSDYHFYPSIYVFVLTGYLDIVRFDNELSDRRPPVISEETQAFNQIITHRFRSLTDDDFLEKVSNVIKFSEEGKYPIYDYVPIANFLIYFYSNGLIDYNQDNIYEILLRGIGISKQSQLLNSRLYQQLLYSKRATDNEIIWEAVKKAHEDIMKEQEKTKINDLLVAVKSSQIGSVEKVFNEYVANPELFTLLTPKDLREALLLSTNDFILEFQLQLQSRYAAGNIKVYLQQDSIFLRLFKVELENAISKMNQERVRKLLFNELIDIISEILVKLQ